MPRVKPHAKIHTSLGNHRKTADMFASNDLLAAYTRVLLLAVERFADRNEDSFCVHASELCRITGTSRIDRAMKVMDQLVASSPVALTQLPPSSDLASTQLRPSSVLTWKLTIPNFAIKQGFAARKGQETEDPPAPAPAPSSKPPVSPTGAKDSPEAKAREAWPALRAAAAEYGVGWIKNPGSAQVRIIAERINLDALTAEQLEAIIRGYITLRGTKADDRFDPLKHLHPSTLYAPKNWPNYLAAAENAPKRKEPKREIFEGYDRSGHKLPTQDQIDAALEEGRKTFEH